MKLPSVQTPPEFLTSRQLCARWGVSHMKLWRMRRAGALRAYNIGHRGIRYSIGDILAIEASAAA